MPGGTKPPPASKAKNTSQDGGSQRRRGEHRSACRAQTRQQDTFQRHEGLSAAAPSPPLRRARDRVAPPSHCWPARRSILQDTAPSSTQMFVRVSPRARSSRRLASARHAGVRSGKRKSPIGLNRRGLLSVCLAPVPATAPAATETKGAATIKARAYKSRTAIEVGAWPIASGAPAPAVAMHHAGNAVDRLHGAKVLHCQACTGRGAERRGASADDCCDAQQSAGAKSK